MNEPKKILSLDGGGIKGALTLGFLKRFEELLKEKHGPDYRMCDYFDLMGGTSTGSIIAAGLSIGLSIDDLRDKYFELGDRVFSKKRMLSFLFGGGFFAAKNIKKELQNVFGDIKLDDEKIKTQLAIFAKRIDTQSLWIIYNNPKHDYWKYQKDYLLRESVRASTAAPTYFEAEPIDVSNDGSQNGLFVDGGLSTANNPSLNLFMLATVDGYQYKWKTGKDNLVIYSFGTGRSVSPYIPKGLFKNLGWAMKAPQVLMEDVSEQNEIMMQLLSHSNRRYFDRVLKDLKGVKITEKPLLDYYRYNIDFTIESLKEIGFAVTEKELHGLRQMDNPKYVKKLYEIGYAASSSIESTHLV